MQRVGNAGLRTMALRSEVAVSTYGCELWRRDGYWVVRCPDNPTYWYGNCLIFDQPPVDGDFERWTAVFAREFGDLREGHRVFRVDRDDGDAGHEAPFREAGFELSRMHVLSANAVVVPRKVAADLEVRPLEGEADWRAALALSVEVGVHDDGHADVAGYTTFIQRRHETYRRMQARGLGHTWGAFLSGTLVGKLGLFHVDELSRFQAVETHREFRRRGICQTLVHRVCELALSERPDRTLVMCAATDYHATRIYQSLGFRITEHHVDYQRPPPGSMRE